MEKQKKLQLHVSGWLGCFPSLLLFLVACGVFPSVCYIAGNCGEFFSEYTNNMAAAFLALPFGLFGLIGLIVALKQPKK